MTTCTLSLVALLAAMAACTNPAAPVPATTPEGRYQLVSINGRPADQYNPVTFAYTLPGTDTTVQAVLSYGNACLSDVGVLQQYRDIYRYRIVNGAREYDQRVPQQTVTVVQSDGTAVGDLPGAVVTVADTLTQTVRTEGDVRLVWRHYSTERCW